VEEQPPTRVQPGKRKREFRACVQERRLEARKRLVVYHEDGAGWGSLGNEPVLGRIEAKIHTVHGTGARRLRTKKGMGALVKRHAQKKYTVRSREGYKFLGGGSGLPLGRGKEGGYVNAVAPENRRIKGNKRGVQNAW